MRWVLPAVLALAFVLLLSACGQRNVKMINGDTFVAEAEAMGFTVTDLMTDQYSDEYYALYEASSDDVYIQYFYAKDDMMATYLYNDDYEVTIGKLTDQDIKSEETSYMFTRLTVSFAADGRYVVVVRSGGTYMYLECTAQARPTVDKFLENISY